MENGRIDLYDSDKMDLKLPDEPLTKITNGTIVKMRRPWSEKEEAKKAGTEPTTPAAKEEEEEEK